MTDANKRQLSVRISPQLMAGLKMAAARDQRTMTNYLVRLITKDCRTHGIPLDGPAEVKRALRLPTASEMNQAREKH